MSELAVALAPNVLKPIVMQLHGQLADSSQLGAATQHICHSMVDLSMSSEVPLLEYCFFFHKKL